jgi:hypothetical protein
MSVVYLLWHIRQLPGEDDEEEEKFIGVYSTQGKAEEAIVRSREQPGFRDSPHGFQIFDHVVDRTGWTEGFISVAEAMEEIDPPKQG